jgi:uroporphyrinogen-III decarboxylase
MKNKRLWIQSILKGEDVPTAQYWMSYFNAVTARKLTPAFCHFDGMSLYEQGPDFDMTGMSEEDLDRLIAFNEYCDRCFACLGKGAAIMFGHGGPGEFFCRVIEENDAFKVVEYETGVKVKVNYNPHFTHSFDHPVKTIEDLDNLQLPDPDDPKRYSGLCNNTRYLQSKNQYVVSSLNGFFSGLHYWLIDYQELLMALITEPEFIKNAARRLGEWNLAAAENMLKAGVDGLAICDDLGSKQNLLMSPQLYRTYFKPWHEKLCQLAHQYNASVHLHSHGAIHPLLDDLVDCGFDFVNPFDPEEGFDIEKTLEEYSGKFVVTGGFPSSFWYWTPEKQDAYLKEMTDLGRKYPRFIFMDSGGVPEDISFADYQRITERSAAHRYANR